MILRDQYFLTCDKSLQTFLKEKGKLSLGEMCMVSNGFYDVHGYPNDKPEHKDKSSGMGKPCSQNKNGSGMVNSGPPTKT